jgi:hypothetical protein
MTQVFPEVRTKMEDIGLLAIENSIVIPNVEDIRSCIPCYKIHVFEYQTQAQMVLLFLIS